MTYGDSFCPSRILFQHSEPANVHAYYEYFRCELAFDADVTKLVMPVSVADEPLPGFNPQIVQQMDQMIIDYLAKLDRNDVLGRARAAILKLLPSGEVSLESVANALNISARTLTRKLNDEGESFKNLLAKTRRDLSEKYIMDKSLTLTEISFLLGFSEASSFSRAYKSWTGRSPSLHRSAIFEGAA
jgi:AraC-like DNA-binding protein